jgi:hypothetical protein
LACGPDAALSHASAAAIWESGRPATDVIDVIHPAPRAHAGVRSHRMRLQPRDVTRRLGMRVTRRARTLPDLASILDARELARAIEQAQIMRLVAVTELHEVVARAGPRHRGTLALRNALAAIDAAPPLTRSEAERRLVELVRAARLPNRWPTRASDVTRSTCCGQTSGSSPRSTASASTGGRAAFERDRRRDGDLLAAGHRVLRVTWRELTDAPEAVIANLARALAR